MNVTEYCQSDRVLVHRLCRASVEVDDFGLASRQCDRVGGKDALALMEEKLDVTGGIVCATEFVVSSTTRTYPSPSSVTTPKELDNPYSCYRRSRDQINLHLPLVHSHLLAGIPDRYMML
jgi:hypothetical protein